MEKAEILSDINNALDDFTNALSLFEEKQIDQIPFEASWTPGQVAEHVILSVSNFTELLNGPDEITERDPAQNVENLKAAFLNFDIKMKSPDFILPQETYHQKDKLISSLKSLKARLNQTIPEMDISKTCTLFKLPVMGYLTRTEIVTFIIVHTQRHTHQLKNIFSKINVVK